MLSEKAKSRAQQKLFGIVRSFQKGELENPSPEVEKIASTMSKSDVKKMASTKHNGLPEKKKIEEVAFLAAAGKVALAAGKGAIKQKAKQVVAQKAANVAQGAIPQPNRDQVQEGAGRAAIGAGLGAIVGGPVGAAIGGSIGAAMGKKKKKVTTGGKKVKKTATNFFKAEPKVTSSEELSIVDKMLIEYSPNVTYQDKKKGKLGKSSIYSLRGKDESKQDFRKSHVKDVEDGYVGAGHKPTPGSLKKHEEIETLRKIVEEVGISSAAAMEKAREEAKLRAKEEAKVAEKKKKKVNEAKVDAGKDDEAKEDARNIRRYGHVPYNKHGHSVLRRSEHRMRRGDKKRPGHKEVNVETGKVGKEIGEAYRVLAKDKTDSGKPDAFSYKDENDANKFAASIRKKGGKATVQKEGVMDIVRKYRKKQKAEKKPSMDPTTKKLHKWRQDKDMEERRKYVSPFKPIDYD